jgi:hypothetical protein
MFACRVPRLITAIFAALAMTVFINARAAFSQDAAESAPSVDAAPSGDATSGASADATSGTSVDANWERVDSGPTIDTDAASADKVLEIPQAKCSGDEDSGPCDANANTDANANDDGGINSPSPGAPPQTFDEDTASTAQDPDWGSVDEYQNQQAYNVPYAIYPYQTNVYGAYRRPSQLPQTTFAPVNGPLTQAVRPPLSQGPWMTPARMSAFSRPAGSPPAYGRPAGGPMMMSAPLVGFRR